MATLNTSFATAGTRSITASYAGDGFNSGSVSAPVTLSVVAFWTSATSLTVSPNPAVIGETVALRAAVTGFNPTGQVNFSHGSTPLGGVALSSGVATLNTSFAAAGSARSPRAMPATGTITAVFLLPSRYRSPPELRVRPPSTRFLTRPTAAPA